MPSTRGRGLSVLFGTAVWGAAVLGGCASVPASTESPAPSGDAEISAADIEVRLRILAHDSMRGREAGTSGTERAASYIAAEAARLGLRPAGDDGSYYQAVPLERRTSRATVTLSTAAGTRNLESSEILPVAGIGGLPRASRSEGSGPLLFGGHLIDPSVGSDDLSLEDMRNAIVIVRLSMPPGVDPNASPPRTPIASLFSPISPAAAVLIVAEETEEEFWDYAAEVARKGLLTLAGANPPSGPTAPPFFLISTAAAERLIGAPIAEARQPRSGLGTLQYELNEEVERIEDRNVVAILPGADPGRVDQYVALGAHYDHVGVGAPVAGDSIYNGADDNASGISALLEVAEALADLPANDRPARSVLFVWHTAEEAGLLGSEHFTNRPTVDRGSIIAHINLDMVGRNHPDTLFSVGARRIASQLGDIVEAVNDRQPRPFVFDYEYDAPDHPEQIYCRSDHYNYARFGIPILFLTTGLHDQYHAPSDEVDLIDFDKAARVASLVRDITLDLANRAERPSVDRPVPPLGTPCS